MTSLSEVYGEAPGTEVDLRRLYLGIGLFLAGVLLVVAGILAAGTTLLTSMGYGLGEARLYGGVLGGLGVPAVFLGIFTVLPANRTTRGTAIVGAAIAILGVAMFWHAYPCQWIGSTCGAELTDLTLATSGVYFLGTLLTFWTLFVGIANFKTRNDPGGTVTMEVTRKGETKIVEVERRLGGLGGIGFLGSTPDGQVETQTNRSTGSGSSGSSSSGSPLSPSPTSDGGADTNDIASPMDTPGTQTTDSAGRQSAQSPGRQSTQSIGTQPTGPSRTQPNDSPGASQSETSGSPEQSEYPTHPAQRRAARSSGSSSTESRRANRSGNASPDQYCGSCTEFRYVRGANGMQPYCELHNERMDNMDACDEWSPRGQ